MDMVSIQSQKMSDFHLPQLGAFWPQPHSQLWLKNNLSFGSGQAVTVAEQARPDFATPVQDMNVGLIHLRMNNSNAGLTPWHEQV